MSRYYPSKDKENTIGRRSQVRDLDSGEKFKTSTLGEIVSLEKSNKNVIGNGYHQKVKIKAKPDKIEHGMESVEKSKVNQSQQELNLVIVKDEAENGPYVKRMIATPGEPDLPVPVPESFHEQTDEELTENDIKWIDADDQTIQTILLGLSEDVYAAVANLKFLNNLQPEWKRHVTIVRQTKNLYEADFAQIYDFLKMNQDENGGNPNGLVVVPGIANQYGTGNIVAPRAEGTRNGNQARCYNCRGLGHIARNCTARPRRRGAAYLRTQLLIAQKEEAGVGNYILS
nr:hypothetical protein [Tanacetum cinerariifolium]